jgi:nitroreductase
MEALQAILTRRSTRNYRPDQVEPEKLNLILDAARQAPSGGNNQTNHFLVIRSRKVLQELVRLAETAFSEMELTEDMYISLKRSVAASKKGGYVFCYNAPVLIVVANRKDYGNNQSDCACAIENMMIAANALDLGSCWINQLRWLSEDPRLLDYLRALGMREDERVYGSVIIGYPASGAPNRTLMEQKGNEVTFVD